MRYKASLTVFGSLSIVMIMSLCFSLVEVVHFTGLSGITKNVSRIGIESAFGDFSRPLLEDYGVLGLDAGYCGKELNLGKMTNRIEKYLVKNFDGKGFLRAVPTSVNILEYGLITDSGGAAFIKQGAIEAGLGLVDTALDALASHGDISSDISGGVESRLQDSINSLETAEPNTDPEAVMPETTLSPAQQEQVERNGNPFAGILEFKARGVLSQVIGDVSSVSDKRISQDRPTNRSISQSGTNRVVSVSPEEKALFGQYIKQKFGSYRKPSESGPLKYEWEYILNGKESDLLNLEATVNTLLLLREGQNYLAILKDPEKMSTASGLALLLASMFLIPEFSEVIKYGVIAAWAYLESVLDVRLLLRGGKVPILKTNAEWTSNILLFPNYFSTSVCAKEAAGSASIDYDGYLMISTLIASEGHLGMRSLDLVEGHIRLLEDYREIRMENFIYYAKIDFEYKAEPVFASVTPMLKGLLSTYSFSRVEELSYI